MHTSVLNFVDLAGISTANGQRIRPRFLYRSGVLVRSEPAHSDLGIETVLDLRSNEERQKHPITWPDAHYLQLAAASEPALVRPTNWRAKLGDPSFGPDQARQEFMALYEQLPRALIPALGSLFAHLLTDPRGATLVHCSAGKDRTGMVIAILLLSLGVPVEAVRENYLASRRRLMSGPAQAVLQGLVEDLPEHAQPAAAVIFSVEEAFLETAMRTIEQKFGGIDAYLSGPCSLGQAERERLQAICLVA